MPIELMTNGLEFNTHVKVSADSLAIVPDSQLKPNDRSALANIALRCSVLFRQTCGEYNKSLCRPTVPPHSSGLLALC